MYEVIQSAIGAVDVSDPNIITTITGVVLCLLVVVFVDMIKDIFFGFFRG